MDAEKKTATLQISHLNKYFGKKQILHDVTFETYAGEVFGFLGPNGAGKTTTIKIVVGLLRLDEGEIKINGYDLHKNYEKALGSIGGIVENPELYKSLTGMQNLRQYARMRDGVSEARIHEVVELVRLKNRINDRVSKYSLGMRQRLGVAQALLHKPQLLILDEPTNGLDPAGIKELRDILKDLAHKENIAVLVSSHLMSEMELMCDRVGIIVNGKLLDVKTIEEMISANQDDSITYNIHTKEPEKAIALLTETAEDKKKRTEEGISVVVTTENAEAEISAVMETLFRGGVHITSCAPVENKKLEDVFIEMTQGGGTQIG